MKRTMLVASLIVLLAGCRSPQGRVMGEGEGDLVGAKSAGAETYNRLIDQSLTKLLARRDGEVKGSSAKVAFVALENKSIEDIGDWQAQIEQVIETTVEHTERYRLISKRFVDAAFRELRFRPDDLFIPAKRREFAQILERDQNPVDFLLFAVLTSGTTKGVEVKQRDYLLTMEIINVVTGDQDKESTRIRKEYQE
jgi:hypothetical protein